MTTRDTAEKTSNKVEYTPATDIVEHKDDYTVVCDMPGVDQNGVRIELEKGILSISGEQNEFNNENNYHREFVAGVYQRTFKIPDLINNDAITAKIKNGVLTVVLPKAEQAKPKAIKVEAA